MKIKFVTDFARNWKAGDVVEAVVLSSGKTLVDNIAYIDTALLMEHCEVVTESEEEIMELDFIQPKKTVGKLISIDVLDKIKTEILEYIDDLDITANICDIFDKYKAEREINNG